VPTSVKAGSSAAAEGGSEVISNVQRRLGIWSNG